MNQITLYLNGMTCVSCEKLVKRAGEKVGASIVSVDSKNGCVLADCPQEKVPLLKQALLEKGFSEKGAPPVLRGGLNGFISFVIDVVASKKGAEYESKLLNFALGSGIILFALAGLLLYFNVIPSLYMPFVFLAVLGSVALAYSYAHAMAYRENMSCMNGMMTGMTLGMIGGFLSGLLIGATNGMFIGSVAGIVVGVVLGLGSGRLCGVMGAMEGIMGGFMSGMMGAMTSVMLLNDNLMAFLYISFGISLCILAFLSYMFYKEATETVQAHRISFSQFLFLGIYLSLFLVAVMLYAPQGPLTVF